MKQIYKNRTVLSLLNSAFDVTDQKYNMVVTSLLSLGQGEYGSDFFNFKRKLQHEKKSRSWFFAIIY